MTDNKNKNYEYLIEEREVLNAKEFANEVFNEVNRILQSNNWKIEINKKNLLVEYVENYLLQTFYYLGLKVLLKVTLIKFLNF